MLGLENLSIMGYFLYNMHQLLLAMTETFDECPLLRDQLDKFEKSVMPFEAIQEKFCHGYHKQMSPYYEACKARDPQPFLEEKIAFLRQIGFREKYYELTDPTENTIEEIEANVSVVWKYIDEINRYAQLFCGMPTDIQEHIQNYAREITEGIVHKGKTPGSFNVLKIGEEILRKSSKQHVDVMMLNMTDMYSAVGGVSGLQNLNFSAEDGERMGGMDNTMAMLNMFGAGQGGGQQPPDGWDDLGAVGWAGHDQYAPEWYGQDPDQDSDQNRDQTQGHDHDQTHDRDRDQTRDRGSQPAERRVEQRSETRAPTSSSSRDGPPGRRGRK